MAKRLKKLKDIVMNPPEYTKEDLKDLATYIGNMKQSLQDQNKGEIWEPLEILMLYLKATYFEPMIFEDWSTVEGSFSKVMFIALEDLPLLVQGDDEKRDILLRWRLNRGK
jgi:hypothetical protein